MSIYPASANLLSAEFPFNLRELPNAVMIARAWEKAEQAAGFAGNSHVYFMQNCLPTQRGFGSVHYTQVVQGHLYPYYLDRVFTLRDADGNVALYSPASGRNAVYTKETGAWEQFPFDFTVDGSAVTTAYLKGTTYVCIPASGLYKYDFGTGTFVAVSTTGIVFDDILGVCAAGQYMLLWTATTLAWSNPLDPTDFVPAVNGAGSTQLLSSEGTVTVILPISGGFVAYTSVNVIGGTLTNNASFPFLLKGIDGASGIASSEHCMASASSATHIAWTSSGMMEITLRGATPIWAELSDAIAQGVLILADFDGTPSTFSYDSLRVKLSSVGNRYVVVSLRNTESYEYQVAYVFDIALKRWGRLDVPHVDIFEYRAPEFVRDLTYADLGETTYSGLGDLLYSQLTTTIDTKVAQFGTTFGVIGKLGAVHIALGAENANLDTLESNASGAAVPTLMFGRYRFLRPNAVTSAGVTVNLGAESAELKLFAHDSSGAVIKSKDTVPLGRKPTTKFARLSGAALSIAVSGRFALTSLEFDIIDGGNRNPPAYFSTVDPEVLASYMTIQGITVTINGEPVTSGG